MAEGDYVSSITIQSTSGYGIANTYTDNTTWIFDNEGDHQPFVPWGGCGVTSPSTKLEIKETPKKIEGVDIMILYDVYLVYAENRKKPIVINKFGVIANSPEDAKVKSGLMKEIDEEWDEDYLTLIVKHIGDVKVKERPKEVKQVK